jgi:hypothetical protein
VLDLRASGRHLGVNLAPNRRQALEPGEGVGGESEAKKLYLFL